MKYEILLIVPFQYPGLNGYLLIYELGDYLCIPYTTILSSLTFIRFYFLLKLFKHMTKWTSSKAEVTCDFYACKADEKFAFKAFQKENPFLILLIILITTCFCFGLSLRNFELLYWESRKYSAFMDWDYMLNSMWCIFISMCAVGYGDFFAKTLIGRFITIMACLIGLYFTSMLMVFMTQKSALNENERKAYNILVRLKLRGEIESERSYIIYFALKMMKLKKQKIENKITSKSFHINYNYEKRNIFTKFEIIEGKIKNIQVFTSVSFKESLFKLTNRIESDVKDLNKEIENIKGLGDMVFSFSDCQLNIAKELKKILFATVQFYDILKEGVLRDNKIFKKLNFVDLNYKLLYDLQEGELNKKNSKINNSNIHSNITMIKDSKLNDKDSSEKSHILKKDHKVDIYSNFNNQNSQEFESDIYEDNIFNYDTSLQEIEKYFETIKTEYRPRKGNILKAYRTLDIMRRRKTVGDKNLERFKKLSVKKDSMKVMLQERKSLKNVNKKSVDKFK
jgi:hypothetical protein